jgi:hypothetical protein
VVRKIWSFLIAFVLLAGIGVGVFFVGKSIWSEFASLQKEVAVGILTAATAIVVATITVVAGRYFERKKEFAIVHRDKKIPVYDEFLKGILQTFWSTSVASPPLDSPQDTVAFLREWQRQLLLWGGTDVVNAYNNWKAALGERPQTIWAIARTEELFLAIRKELGHDDRKLPKHSFVGFILSEPELFKAAAKINPSFPMQELAHVEEDLKRKREG